MIETKITDKTIKKLQKEVDRCIKCMEENADAVAQTIYNELKKESKTIGDLKKKVRKQKMDVSYRKPHLADFLFGKIEKLLDAEIEATPLQ